MARRTSRIHVPRERADGYAAKGREFLAAAQASRQGGHPDSAALLFVHGVISYADAVCVRLGQAKSASDRHLDAVALLRELSAATRGADEALEHLKKVLAKKNEIAYDAPPIRPQELDALQRHAMRFQEWAQNALGE